MSISRFQQCFQLFPAFSRFPASVCDRVRASDSCGDVKVCPLSLFRQRSFLSAAVSSGATKEIVGESRTWVVVAPRFPTDTPREFVTKSTRMVESHFLKQCSWAEQRKGQDRGARERRSARNERAINIARRHMGADGSCESGEGFSIADPNVEKLPPFVARMITTVFSPSLFEKGAEF